jgi:excisionase family DNA binding protein
MTDFSELPDLLTTTEVATLLRVTNITVKRWHKSGKIKAIRINSRGDRRFLKSDLKVYLGIE